MTKITNHVLRVKNQLNMMPQFVTGSYEHATTLQEFIRSRMRIQTHHIEYDPDWTVDIGAYMHKCITVIQRSGTTEERYAILTGFMHALAYEWNRMRRELDQSESNT